MIQWLLFIKGKNQKHVFFLPAIPWHLMEVCKRKWHLPGKLWIVHVSLENLDTPATCPVTISKLLINPSPPKKMRENNIFLRDSESIFPTLNFWKWVPKQVPSWSMASRRLLELSWSKTPKAALRLWRRVFLKRCGEINFFCSWVS